MQAAPAEVTVHDAEPELIADLTAFGNYAYLARWGGEDCAGPEGGGPDGGVYIIDISDPANPREVGFIRTHQDTLVGEGMQVVHVTTLACRCGTSPTHCIPEAVGALRRLHDRRPAEPAPRRQPDPQRLPLGRRGQAYLVAADDEEVTDVDIFDVTDPKHPVLIGEPCTRPKLVQPGQAYGLGPRPTSAGEGLRWPESQVQSGARGHGQMSRPCGLPHPATVRAGRATPRQDNG